MPGAGGAFFVAKLDPGGACTDVTSFGSAGSSAVWLAGVASDSLGEAIVSGNLFSNITIGMANLTAPGIFLAKFDLFGAPVWANGYAQPLSQPLRVPVAVQSQTNGSIGLAITCLAASNLGGVSLGAATSGICAAQYDPSGAHLWSKQFAGSPGTPGIWTVAWDTASPALIMAGALTAPVDFGTGSLTGTNAYGDAFVAKVVP